jgi:DNA-binding transcriptional ArsR family regulator
MIKHLVLLGLFAAVPPASASPVEVDMMEARGCLAPPACIVGYESGPAAGLGDDRLYLATVFEAIRVQADVPGAPPVRKEITHDTHVEHPFFVTGERAFAALDAASPDALEQYIRFRSGTARHGWQGFWVDTTPWALVPIMDDPDNSTLTIPVIYTDHGMERERYYPFGRGGEKPVTDEDLYAILALLTGHCRPEEAQHLAAVCSTRSGVSGVAWTFARDALPAFAWNSGFQRATVVAGALPPSPAAREAPVQDGISGSAVMGVPGARGALVQEQGLRGSADAPWTGGQSPTRTGGAAGSEAMVGELAQGAWPVPSTPVVAALAVAALVLLAVALYRRLQPKDLLAHPKRQALLALVQRDPGVTIGEAARVLGLSYKTAMHHADLLIEASHLAVHLHGRERRLFPPTREFQREARQRVVALDRPSVRAVLALLDQVGPVPRREVGPRAGLSRTAAWVALETLRSQGVVAVEPGPRGLVRPASPAHISEAASPPPLGA